MRLAIDVMGGDHGPAIVVQGALRALTRLEPGTELSLVGDETQIRAALPPGGTERALHIVHAPDVIGMHEAPAAAARHKSNSSIAVALRLLRDGEAQAVLSPGNTGGVVASALLTLGRIPKVLRPAIATLFPTEGTDCVLLDVGANSDCKPLHLCQFAVMGAVYAQIRLGVAAPRVGLLNIGEEETKGNKLAVATYPQLRDSNLNFVGNVEGRDLLAGKADVVVCDGFVGNIVLKFAESILRFTTGVLRLEIERRPELLTAQQTLRPAFDAVKKRLDYQEFGGAPLLGIDGIVVIAHGKSSERAIESAVLACAQLAANNLTAQISEHLRDLGGNVFEKSEQRSDLGNR